MARMGIRSTQQPNRNNNNNNNNKTMNATHLRCLLALLTLAKTPLPTHSQGTSIPATWETSNDPDNLCNSPPQSGYRATLDCRGYVYCNNGYLMGGVIPCWPNQLFDAEVETCTSWQGVVDKGNMEARCPAFDGSMMMPDLTDGNANPDRFFCGASSSNAKRVCEPCPGGSRLECSDPSHNCFAGVTGCPVNPPSPSPPSTAGSPPPPPPPSPPTAASSPSVTNNSPSTAGSPTTASSPSAPSGPTTPTFIQNFPTPVPTRNPTPYPTPYPSRNPTNKPSDDNNDGLAVVNIDNDTFNAIASNLEESTSSKWGDDLLHGHPRSSYYCGYSWDFLIRSCESASPCDTGLSSQCPMGQTCFPGTPCAEILKEKVQPTPKPTSSPISAQQASYYCGYNWDWVHENCFTAVPCPEADASGVCPAGMKCLADTQCATTLKGGPTPLPTRTPTKSPTYPPVEGDDPNKRFCGYDWADVTANCLIAVPCKHGDSNMCPDKMNCIANTPCDDEDYLNMLRETQSSYGSGSDVVVDSVVTEPAPKEDGACAKNGDCEAGEFCNYGYCGECSILDDSYNMGCSTEQICKTAGCQQAQVWGPTTCYNVADLDAQCVDITGVSGALCNTNQMKCEFSSVSSVNVGSDSNAVESNEMVEKEDFSVVDNGDVSASVSVPASVGDGYDNPDGNLFFCGNTYYTILEKCLQSKPCPGGFGGGICADDEGCFSVIQCTTEYEEAKLAGPPLTKPPSPSPTSPPVSTPSGNPTQLPTTDSQSITTTIDATPAPTSGPTTSPTVGAGIQSITTTIDATPAPTSGPTTSTTTSPILPSITVPIDAESLTETLSESPTQKPTSSTAINASPGSVTFGTKSPVTSPPSSTSNESENYPTTPPHSPKPTLPFPTIPQNTGSPTVEVINTNYCGVEWVSHAQNCPSAIPCPNGDECPSEQTCFNDSPCAQIATPPEGGATESKIKHLCGSDWNTLMAGCMNATPCPTGTECAEGEFCYRNFECDPPPTTSTTSTIASGIQSADVVNTVDSQILTESTVSSNGAEVNNGNEQENQGASTSGGAIQTGNDQTESAPVLEPCDICGTAGQLDWSKTIEFNGTDISCGEFGWIFASNNVFEGTNQCLMMRASYFGSCCFSTPEEGCYLCDTGADGIPYELRTDVNVVFDGETLSCTEMSTKMSSKFEATSKTCTDAQVDYFSECCFEKCSICGDAQLDWEASVYFGGKEMPCYEFDKVFQEDGVSEGTTSCGLTQDLYKKECCIEPPQYPCNLCQSGSTYYQMNSDVLVSYDGVDSITCLEVYSSLFSRREQSSEHCIKTQGDLFPQCCSPAPGLVLPDQSPTVTEDMSGNTQSYQGGENVAPSPSSGRGDYTGSIGESTGSPTTTYRTYFAGDLGSPSHGPKKLLSAAFASLSFLLWVHFLM